MALPWLLAATAVTLLIVTALVWLVGSDQVSGQVHYRAEKPIMLPKDQPLTYTFVPLTDGLHRLDFMLVSFRQIPDSSIHLAIRTDSGALLARQEFDARVIRDGWYSIDFPALTGIEGQPLHLELRRDPSARLPVGIRVAQEMAGNRDSRAGLEQDAQVSLAFRAYYAVPPTPAARLSNTLQRAQTLAAVRPGLFGQAATPLTLGAAYAAMFSILLVLVTSHARRS